MTVRALSFGAIAQAYESFRAEYPEELFEAVADYAGGTPRTALEIGAGTGKATRLFVRHGVEVTATDPDPGMLAELRKNVPGVAHTMQATLEDMRPDGGTYGLVFVAAALHWTRAEGRWERVAALLEPGGVFASFVGPFRPADPAVVEAVRLARAPFLADDEIPSPDGTPYEADMKWPGTELLRSSLFTDVRQVTIERRFTLSARGYGDYLSTVSAYLQLPEAERRRALDAIMQALPANVEITADVIGHLARRRPEA